MGKSPNISSFKENLPQRVNDILSIAHSLEIRTIIVGGATRDFFMGKSDWYRDIDVEIRPKAVISDQQWEKILSKLEQKISIRFGAEFEKLEFEIIRVKHSQNEVELSPARVEKFREGEFGHKNFDAEIRAELSDQMAFKRRDFTFNAIGIEIKEDGSTLLIDPFGGLGDLQKRTIRPCSDDFSKDPVRFLRMIRFAIKENLNYPDECDQLLKRFNLKNLSTYYLLEEATKSKDLVNFFYIFYKLTYDFEIPLPAQIMEVSFLRNIPRATNEKKIDTIDSFGFHMASSLSHISSTHLQVVAKVIGVKVKVLLNLRSYFQHLADLDIDQSKLLLEKIRQKKIEFDEILKEDTFHQLHQLKGVSKSISSYLEKYSSLIPDALLQTHKFWMETMASAKDVEVSLEEATLEASDQVNRKYLKFYCQLRGE
ncbi:MAG: CCA tRNA nucleotidyltransferase [Bacteriovoracaceae bacterium]|jgi:hypothetical protein|nr:CCA tRNA nucleotidyltransferase [Bacteriovoracaceae bacterium]